MKKTILKRTCATCSEVPPKTRTKVYFKWIYREKPDFIYWNYWGDTPPLFGIHEMHADGEEICIQLFEGDKLIDEKNGFLVVIAEKTLPARHIYD